jgi:hypothetical protein
MSAAKDDKQHPHTEHNIHQGQLPKKGQDPHEPEKQHVKHDPEQHRPGPPDKKDKS